jgi:cytochrome c biogenesis protein CcdA/thiol-disulfide isomerase/thioredoxin
MTLLILSFIAGLLTVLAPCVLPLLPVIVGGSLSGKKEGPSMKRAFTVTLSLAVSVVLFTFLLKASTLFITIPESFWVWVSGGIIIVFGVVSLFPELWERVTFAAKLNQQSNVLLGAGYQKKSFWGDVIVGAALGPVFSTCSPTYFVVLATVLPVDPLRGFVYILAYTIGLSLSLLLIAFVGERIMSRLNIAADPHGWFKRTLGVVFILVGLAIITGVDKKLERNILDLGLFDVTTIEQRLLEEEAGAKGQEYPRAPEITAPAGFINTDAQPITISQYRGQKVVLIDFWTYSCINCQRTFPYLISWHEKYKDQGLVIIGVHTPEFAFEHVQSNVEKATRRFGITYPVVLDNAYGTWSAFGNRFWPRKYLINIDGEVVYDHAGEGAYAETEKKIQELLRERSVRLGTADAVSEDITKPANALAPGRTRTPEIYIGAERNADHLGNGVSHRLGKQDFVFPKLLIPDHVYLAGSWNVSGEYAETSALGAQIRLNYGAAYVYMVLSAPKQIKVKVLLDGRPLGTRAGADVITENGESYLTISEERLYDIVRDGEGYGEHTLEFTVEGAGLKVFTFTFG